MAKTKKPKIKTLPKTVYVKWDSAVNDPESYLVVGTDPEFMVEMGEETIIGKYQLVEESNVKGVTVIVPRKKDKVKK